MAISGMMRRSDLSVGRSKRHEPKYLIPLTQVLNRLVRPPHTLLVQPDQADSLDHLGVGPGQLVCRVVPALVDSLHQIVSLGDSGRPQIGVGLLFSATRQHFASRMCGKVGVRFRDGRRDEDRVVHETHGECVNDMQERRWDPVEVTSVGKGRLMEHELVRVYPGEELMTHLFDQDVIRVDTFDDREIPLLVPVASPVALFRSSW
jgi:hypothetical protein